ncbi:MAG: hypothetical protein K8I60_02730 [Anaerolineae bacterium]|nr:hypothetical protein [Anaerolineae bacterium]
MEELVASGRIELEDFLVLEVKEIDRGERRGHIIRQMSLRLSKKLRNSIHKTTT